MKWTRERVDAGVELASAVIMLIGLGMVLTPPRSGSRRERNIRRNIYNGYMEAGLRAMHHQEWDAATHFFSQAARYI
jgi:hypothetical protein